MDDLTVPGRPSPQAPQPIIQQAPQSLSLLPSTSVPMPADAQPARGISQDPQGASMNYNNSDDVAAVRSANAANAPQGGMANPGVYGLLPQGLQHGTLRNVLGALGDAFLTGANKPTEYEPRMQRQEIGNAMAGYNPEDPDSVRAAASRVAATGATGAPEMADKLQQQAEQAALRRATIEQTGVYRQSLTQSRNDNLFNRMYPLAAADLSQATDAADYAARKARWDQRIHMIDPSMDATAALGLPGEYIPNALTSTAGMNNNQVNQHQDRLTGQASGRRNTDVRAAATIRAAGIGAGSRVDSANINANKETPILRREYLSGKADKAARGLGPPLDAGEQREFDHDTQVSRNSRRPTSSAATAPAAPSGPGASDAAYLKAHPELRAQFDSHFGHGAAAKILGH